MGQKYEMGVDESQPVGVPGRTAAVEMGRVIRKCLLNWPMERQKMEGRTTKVSRTDKKGNHMENTPDGMRRNMLQKLL